MESLGTHSFFLWVWIFFPDYQKAGVCTTSTTENPYENRTVCYKYVGCFNNLPPFDNAAYDLPRSPEEIGTEFLLFTRRNPSNPDRLDYVSQSSVVSSHFQNNVQTSSRDVYFTARALLIETINLRPPPTSTQYQKYTTLSLMRICLSLFFFNLNKENNPVHISYFKNLTYRTKKKYTWNIQVHVKWCIS